MDQAEQTEDSFEVILHRLKSRLVKAQSEVDELTKAIDGMELAGRLTKRSCRAHSMAAKASYGKLAEAVTQFVDALPGDFTVEDVLSGLNGKEDQKEALNGSLNRDSITSVLRRLTEQNRIVVKEQGRGRRMGRYGKPLVYGCSNGEASAS